MTPGRPDRPGTSPPSEPAPSAVPAGRHSLRDQDTLWTEFLSLASSVVVAMEKCVKAVTDGSFELIEDLQADEEESDRREVQIERECMRIMALYEPVASDLRRMATVLKVNRDWERIADLALRVARRARKFSRLSGGTAMPDQIKQLASDVLAQVRASHQALVTSDAAAARIVIAGDKAIDAQYRAIRKQLRSELGQDTERLDAVLILMNAARNLERIADHAAGIAMTAVYLKEGVIIRHTPEV